MATKKPDQTEKERDPKNPYGQRPTRDGGTTRSPLKAEPGGQSNYNTKKSKNLQKPIREPRSQTTTARQRPPKTAKSRGGIHEGKNTHQENTATLTTSERTYTKNGIRSASRVSGKFFFFVSRRASKAECNAKSPILRTRNTDTRPQNCTTPDCTLHVNMPQDGCTSTPKVAGVMSPATPYRNTRQDKQIQGKTAQQDELKDARDTL